MMEQKALFERGCRVIPGGVNSPVRAFQAVGGTPLYVASARGCRLTSVDGRELIDFCGSWGPLILGHAEPTVVEAIRRAAGLGTSFGVNTAQEVAFAELICGQIPSMDQLRLVNSGTEATMTALRLARGVTGRNTILKFDGCYHGHADYLLVSAGSGVLTSGRASSAGICDGAIQDVRVAPYNDLQAVEQIVADCGDDLAAIIVEPVAGNMGLITPVAGFLEGLRAAADRCGALLIFDEVITGFRLGPTTYGTLCGVSPDLSCLGKIIGGGLPIGALGGRREVMSALAPLGDVYQAGTLSGNPVAVAAGVATLQRLIEHPPYDRLAELTAQLAGGVRELVATRGLKLSVQAVGSLFTLFFRADVPDTLAQAKEGDTAAFARFFHRMLARGIYLPPSAFEVCFVSAAHAEAEIAAYLAAADEALA